MAHKCGQTVYSSQFHLCIIKNMISLWIHGPCCMISWNYIPCMKFSYYTKQWLDYFQIPCYSAEVWFAYMLPVMSGKN